MSIKGDISQYVVRKGASYLFERMADGGLVRYGSMVRNSGNGQLVGYIQETKVIGAFAATGAALLVSAPATAVATAGYATAKTVHSIFDTNRTVHHISDKVDDIHAGVAQLKVGQDRLDHSVGQVRSGIDLLGRMELANLALSASGIGISVIGFAVVSAKIDRVRQAVEGLGSQLHALTAQFDNFRQDQIEADYTILRTLAEQMDEAWLLDGSRAERQWHDIAREAHKLQNHFDRRAKLLLESPAGYRTADPMLDSFALASGLRVAALVACNETGAAIRRPTMAMRSLTA